MSLFDFVLDAKDEIIDLYFILSDLVEINLTEAEQVQTAYFDAMASNTAGQDGDGDVPIGKLVL